MIALFPYNLDTPIYRLPIANWVLGGVMILVQVLVELDVFPPALFEAMILDGWAPLGLVGYTLLHAGWLHLFGNLLFLYTFGNAVNAKVGHAAYVALFFGLGAASAAAHNLWSGGRAVGASGAINGVVGMCFLLYPFAYLKMIFWFVTYVDRFRIRAVWMLLLFFAFDVWGALQGVGRTAYFAHIGGFAAGAGIALALVAVGWIRAGEYEETLLDWLRERRGAGAPVPVPVPAETGPRPSGAAGPRPWAHAAPLAPSAHRVAAPSSPSLAPARAASPPQPAAASPASAAAPPRATAPSPSREAAEDTVAVRCEACGQQMQAPARLHGKKVRCPGCSAVLTVGA